MQGEHVRLRRMVVLPHLDRARHHDEKIGGRVALAENDRARGGRLPVAESGDFGDGRVIEVR